MSPFIDFQIVVHCSTYTRNPVVCLLDWIKYSLNCIANLFMANKIQSSTHPFSLNPSLIQASKPITFNQHQCTSLKRFASLLAPLRKSGYPSCLITWTCPIDAPLYAYNSTLEKTLEWNYPVFRELRIQLTFMAVGESLLRSYTSMSVLRPTL